MEHWADRKLRRRLRRELLREAREEEREFAWETRGGWRGARPVGPLGHPAVLRGLPRSVGSVIVRPGEPAAGGGEELFELEAEFMEAAKRRDVAYLDRVLGANFVLTNGRPGAEVLSGEEWREASKDSRFVG